MSNLKIKLFAAVIMLYLAVFCTPAAAEPIADPSTEPSAPEIVTQVPEQAPNNPPVISFSDTPESDHVTVHIYAPEGVQLSDKDVIAYRIGDEDQWRQYVTSLPVTENCVIHAIIVYADGSRSPEAVLTIGNIDSTPPTVPVISADLTKWVKDVVQVEISPGTDAESGYMRTEYRIGADGQWTEYTAKLDIKSACVLYARGVDNAGNYSEEVNVKINNFDLTPPNMGSAAIVLSSPNGFAASESNTFSKIFRGDVSASITGIRDDESGLAYLEYQTAGSTSSLADANWKKCELNASPQIKGDFCGYLFVRAVDKVGNVSQSVSSEGFIIDVTPPVIGDIVLSPATLTEGRVTIKFAVNDNSQLSEVSVNGTYVGVYSTSYTVYRNGEYVIRAVDAAGNTASRGVTVNNINSTPFTLVNTFNSLKEDSFTPSSWAEAKTAATALQGQLTVGASEAQISAANERLLTAMEALVPKGDGTASLQLIDRISTEYNKDNYTESSWNSVEEKTEALKKLLDNPERTQEDVDNARRALENSLVDLVPRGSFEALDTLIAQCENLDSSEYDKLKYTALMEALNNAKALPRTDSSQEDVDACYQALLTASLELKDAPKQEGFKFTLIFYIIIVLLIIAIGTALFIINKRMRSEKEGQEDGEDDGSFDGGHEQDQDPFGQEQYVQEPVQQVGDLYFTNDESPDDDDDYSPYAAEINEDGEDEDSEGEDPEEEPEDPEVSYIGRKRR